MSKVRVLQIWAFMVYKFPHSFHITLFTQHSNCYHFLHCFYHANGRRGWFSYNNTIALWQHTCSLDTIPRYITTWYSGLFVIGSANSLDVYLSLKVWSILKRKWSTYFFCSLVLIKLKVLNFSFYFAYIFVTQLWLYWSYHITRKNGTKHFCI